MEQLYLHDLDELLGSLPACRRCRLNKRRCDTQLPSCHVCSKSGVECVFFDHVLQEDVSRAYVFSLLQRLQETRHKNARPAEGYFSQRFPADSASPASMESDARTRTSRYVGSLSCLSLSVADGVKTQAQQTPAPPILHMGDGPNCVMTQETHEYLVTTYLTDIHSLYPFLDESLPFLSSEWLIDRHSTELEPRHHFMLELVYSIASHHILDHVTTEHQRHCYRTLSDECHRRGLAFFDSAATDISIPTLQAVTLATLHSLFAPQQGNCGQLIGLAARLAIDLSTSDHPRVIRSEEATMQQIYKSIYCIENQFTTALDRPGLLPEPANIKRIDVQNPQTILCALYQIQSRFRCCANDVEAVISLSHQLARHINYLEQQPIKPRPNLLALAFETHLLLHPNDEASSARLLEVYMQQHYVRTFLSPQWAYRAGVTIASKSLRQGQQLRAGTSWNWSGPACQAYGHFLVFLEQCSRRWPSAGALKRSMESFVSGSSRCGDNQDDQMDLQI